jgi:heme O synthase-like polyprenyltransferase
VAQAPHLAQHRLRRAGRQLGRAGRRHCRRPAGRCRALALAFVLFLWTPPHFWSLAIAFRDDYARAGVPMLPVVVGDARAAQVIFASTVALVAASFIPLFFGLGAIYFVGAALGGGLFVQKAWRWRRTPIGRPR